MWVGEIVIQSNSNFCFVCFSLEPHDSYLLGMQVTFVVGGVESKVTVPLSEIVPLSGSYHTNAFGVLCATGTFNQSTMGINYLLGRGGQFVVFSLQFRELHNEILSYRPRTCCTRQCAHTYADKLAIAVLEAYEAKKSPKRPTCYK